MSAIIINGKDVAAKIETELAVRVAEIVKKSGKKPTLAVVLVGDNPASKVYVKAKSKRAHACGMDTIDCVLPADTTDQKLQSELKKLSDNPKVDGILLQLPLPKGLDEFSALLCIAPEKDVDGLHPVNQGLLMRGAKCHRPCTPSGSIVLIDEALEKLGKKKDLSGYNAVVVGRSILVGKPVGIMLLERNCTVTYCHSRTKNLAGVCRGADILIAAVGRPEMITADFVKPGAIVIDVGINRLDDGKLVGDVKYDEVSEVAAAITPVPGGVGPMTIAMLLSNTVDSAEAKIS